MEKTVEELKRARQHPVIRSKPVSRVSEKEDGEIVHVWAPVPARGALAASKEKLDQ